MILFGSSLSPFVRKVMVYAAERGISFDFETSVFPNPSEAFLKASPLRKMPALADGDFSIADSTAIITYLDAKLPDGGLLPTDPQARARTIWYEEYADTVMSQVVFKAFFNRVIAPKLMKMPGDEAAAVEGETVLLPPILAYLEGVVPAAGKFLIGDALTLADIAIANPFINFDEAGIKIDAAKYPKVTAWVASMLARPSFVPIIDQEKAMLAQMS
jgi:glutathione S-transferase